MENKIKIVIAADHGGFEMKSKIIEFLLENGYEVKDLGTHSDESVDYPDYAHPMATAVKNGEYQFGILICGTGNGMAITANKHEGIRAGLAWNAEVGALVKQHNNANVLCMSGRFVSIEESKAIVKAYLEAEFLGDRHERRINKINC